MPAASLHKPTSLSALLSSQTVWGIILMVLDRPRAMLRQRLARLVLREVRLLRVVRRLVVLVEMELRQILRPLSQAQLSYLPMTLPVSRAVLSVLLDWLPLFCCREVKDVRSNWYQGRQGRCADADWFADSMNRIISMRLDI